MEYVGHQMITNNLLPDTVDQPYNGYPNIYQAMCVTHDFTNEDNSNVYKEEELALEVI